MKNSQRLFLSLLLIMSFVFAACGGGEDVVVETPAATEAPEEPTDEPEPTATPEPEPTDTPEPEPTATADPAADFELFEDTENGISVRYPGDWFTQGALGFNTFASAEELLDQPDPGEEGGVALLIAGDAGEIGTTDPVEALTRAADEFDLGEDTEFVEGPTAITVNGLDGAVATVYTVSDNGTPLSALFGIVFNGERAGVFIGVTPRETEADFFPIFEAMLNTVVVTEPAVVETPGIDLPESQGFLLYGDTVNGTVGANETVVWDFIGIEGEVFDLTVEPDENLDIILNILDAEGNSILDGEVDDSFGTEQVTGITVPSTGDFYVVLTGFSGSSGDYSLTINEAGTSSTNGEELAASGSLAYGDQVQSSVPAGNSAKWSFTAAAGDVVNITVSPLDDDLDAVVDVLDAAGNSILPAGEVDESFDDEEINALVITTAGNYIISVRGFADSTGNFELSLSSSTSGTVPSGDALAYGESVAGTITGSEAATFTFFGDENDLVDVTVDPLTDGLDVILDVWDSNGRSILEDGEMDISFDTEFLRVQRLPASGAYSIVVTGFEGSTGDFEVTLNLTNNGEVATVLYTFYEIEEADETHAFPFNALAGDQVTAIINPVGVDFDVVLEIYDDDADELVESVDMTTGFEELVFVAPVNGNYYFQVSGFEGSLGEYDVILVGPASTQFVLAAGDTIDGQFTEDASTIEYWYDGLAGETIEITLEGDEELDVVIRILDEDGNVLAEVDEGLYGETETLSYTFEEEIAVIIEVSDFFSGNGFFDFLVESDM